MCIGGFWDEKIRREGGLSPDGAVARSFAEGVYNGA